MVEERNKTNMVQTYMAIASFIVGTMIACVCLFAIEPLGEIANTAISIVSEFLILAGTLLGVKATFDHRWNMFEKELNNKKDKDDDE